MKIKTAILAAATAAIMAACTPQSTESQLRQAEDAIIAGNITAATSVARHLTTPEAMQKLSATQAARLSLVYMQIADSTDYDSNIATAVELYRHAMHTGPDSAHHYFQSIPSDKIPHLIILQNISHPGN